MISRMAMRLMVTAEAAAKLPYTTPTPADIKLDFPQFAAVDDAAIQRVIDRNPMWIDESWFEGDYTWARELLTAHFLTLQGQGTGADAAQSISTVSRLKSGTLDITRKSAKDGAASVPDQWAGTVYGQQFYDLLCKNKRGVYVATGGGCGIGPQSTDVPFAWAFGGFAL